MDKTIARRYCAIGPFFYCLCPEELLASRQPRAECLDFSYFSLCTCSHCWGRKFSSCHTRYLQHALLVRVQPVELFFDHLLDGLRNNQQILYRLRKRTMSSLLSLGKEVIHHGDHEERIALGALMDQVRELSGHWTLSANGNSLRQICC